MELIYLLIAIMFVADALIFAMNKLFSFLRKRDMRAMLQSNRVKTKLLGKIDELNKQIDNFKRNHVKREEYNDLLSRHNILLNRYRTLLNRYNALRSRMDKLKEKLY